MWAVTSATSEASKGTLRLSSCSGVHDLGPNVSQTPSGEGVYFWKC